ncbi:MAG: ATP-binding protein [Bacteroidales bacterium]|nr:ATP-binding protein [Bacteroidales bacterium]
MNEDLIRDLIKTDENGRILRRESKTLEFKESFNMNAIKNGDLSKSIAAFANTRGGVIIFGVTDSPRKAKGLTNTNFDDIQEERLTECLNNQFAPELLIEVKTFDLDGKRFGAFIVKESTNKPVICTQNGSKIKEGEIYYRYSGRSEKIKHAELLAILDEVRENERKKWMEHIQKIAQIGPQNIALIDVYRGNLLNPQNKEVILDKSLLKEIKFIQEGRFVEKEGAPALKLLGHIEGMEGIQTIIPDINLDDDFYTTKEIGAKLGILSDKGSTNYVTALIWHYKIQDNPKYYQHKHHQKLYSKLCLDFLQSKEHSMEEIKAIHKDYQKRNKG